MKRLLILTIFVSLGLSSCKKVPNSHPINNEWNFVSFENISASSIEIPPSSIRQLTIGFDKGKTFGGNGPVNGLFGDCKVYRNGDIDIIELATTFEMGDSLSMEWEHKYFVAINNIFKYDIDGNELRLYYNSEEEVLHYKKKE